MNFSKNGPVSLALLFFVWTSFAYCTPEHSNLQKTFIGQKYPGLKAQLFAPDLVSSEYFEGFASFTPNNDAFYFIRAGGSHKLASLRVVILKNGQWQESAFKPPIVWRDRSIGEPFFSPDGKTLFLGNKYMVKTESGWSSLKSLPSPFSDIPIMRLSVSSLGTYVFDVRDETGLLGYSRMNGDKREKPEAFGAQINSGKWTPQPFLAADESYLNWDSEREGGFGGADLYISFRQRDGSWGPAINMGEGVNSELDDTYATVTPNKKHLFFHRYFANGKVNIYWLDASLIELLRQLRK
jgi:hypothetical protein